MFALLQIGFFPTNEALMLAQFVTPNSSSFEVLKLNYNFDKIETRILKQTYGSYFLDF